MPSGSTVLNATTTGYKHRPNTKFFADATMYSTDAGITAISAPVGTQITGVSTPVSVSLKNFGSDTLVSVDIHYSVNGTLQGTYIWAGMLTEDMVATNINIGNAVFNDGNNVLRVWTSMPNGTADMNNSNDTSSVILWSCQSLLNGTYSINSAFPTGGTNFQTVNDALAALNNCGVNGAVIFEMHDALYDLTIALNEVPGSSVLNSVTFKPAPGQNVVITSTSTTSTIRLNATKNLIFDGSNDGTGGRNLTIRNTSSATNTAAVWLSSVGSNPGQGCENIIIKNCIVEAGSNSTTSAFGIYVGGATISTTGTGNNNHNIKIQNNQLRLSYIAIYSRSASPGVNMGLIIEDNVIGSTNPTEYVAFRGIDLQGATNTIISGNRIFNLILSTSVNNAGIEIGQNVTGAKVVKNNIHTIRSLSTSGYGAYGINIASGTGVNDILIANNFISDIVTVKYSATSTTWNPFGIRITGGTNIRIFHNSINLYGEPLTGTSASMSACLLITAAVTGLDVRNNIFANSMTGNAGSKSYCVHKATAVTFANSNYNNYFPSGPFGLFGYTGTADVATLAGWQAVTTFDLNSVAINPLFISDTDLHTFNPSMNNLGTPIAEVPDDIDGELRDTLTPDIGADEYEPLALDLALNDILYPPAAPCGLTNNELISFRVKNMGSTPVTSFIAAYEINGGTEIVETFTTNILPDSLQSFVFTASADFSSFGTYLLSVRVKLTNDLNPLNDSINGYEIRHSHNFFISEYTMGFEIGQPHQDWTVFNQDGSAFKWDVPFAGIANTGSNSARFSNGAANTGEDWMFSRCFAMQAGEAYDLSYFFRGSSTASPASFQVFAGNSNTPSAMTILLADHPNILQTTYQKSTVRFTVPVSGAYYFGWKNNTPPSAILTYIDDVNVKLIPPQEAAILGKIAPDDGCDLGQLPLTVQIKNTGSDTITSLNMYYQVTGNVVVQEFVNVSIAPGDTLDYTFLTLIDLTTPVDSVFEITSWINLPGDPIQSNDTTSFEINSLVTPNIPFVINDTINYGAQAELVATSNATIFWFDDFASTTPFHTGDTLVTVPLFSTTSYYVEASNSTLVNIGLPAALSTATSGAGTTNFGLVFDVFSPTLLKSVTVYPVSASSASGTVTIDVINSSGVVLHTTTANVTGSPVGTFLPHVINLNYNLQPGTNLKMRPAFTGITGLLFEPSASAPGGNYGYPFTIPGVISINTSTLTAHPTNTPRNDLYYYFYNWEVGAPGCTSDRTPITAVVNLPPYEPEIISIVNPMSEECSDNATIVSVEISNNGTDTITSGLYATYQVQGGAPVTETVSDPVAPGDTILFTFNTTFGLNLTQGDSAISIKSWVHHPSDPYNLNDTIYKDVTLGFIPPMPMAENDTIAYATEATLVAVSPYNLQWYETPTSTIILDTGHVFVTPVLFANTPYYVSALETSSAKESMGMANALSTSSFITATVGWGLFFSNTEPIYIDSVYVYPSGSGTITIQILDSLDNAVLFSGATNNISGDGTNSPANKKPVFVGLTIPPGSYKMGMTYAGITDLVREISGANHPYVSPSGVARITAGASGSATPSTGTYYWFYDWKIKTASLGCESPRTEVWAIIDTLTFPNVDAGVVSVDEPVSPANLQQNDVKITIRNYGSNPLTTVDIAWKINGIAQPTYTWNGFLNQGDFLTNLTIGTATFFLGQNDIVVWTENPNGMPDMYNINDTAFYSLVAFEPLCGTYLVGGANSDFTSIDDAIFGLVNYGLTCPVVFELMLPVFSETLVFDSIPGSSAVNTVTFRPGPGMSVEITSSSSTATVKFNAARNIIFDGFSGSGSMTRDLTISNTGTGSNSAAIWISSTGATVNQGCQNITIKNCKIEGASNSVTSAFGVFIGGTTISTTGTGNHNNNITLLNNHIMKSYIAIYSRSASPNFNTGLKIENNVIGHSDPLQYVTFRGIDLQGATNPLISGNHIYNLILATTVNNSGIEIGQNVSGAKIVKNNIHTLRSLSTSGYGAYGINIATATGVNDVLIANNFVSDIVTVKYSTTSTTWNPFGIRVTGGANIRIYNNSINLFGEPTLGASASMSACLLVTAAVSGLDVRNNIFANSMTGNTGSKSYCVYRVSSAILATSNYNNYFPSGQFGFFGYSGTADVSTLAAWRTVTGQDLNSITANPNFLTDINLHTFSANVNDLAQPLAEVTDDIDGDPRHPVTPDIGADEFDPVAKDAAVVAGISPSSGCDLTISEIIIVRLKNSGLDTIYTMNVSYSVNGGIPVVETWNGSLATNEILDYSFTQTADLSGSGIFNIFFQVYLAGDALALNDTLTYRITSGHDFFAADYFMGFEPGEDYSRWTVMDVNNDGRTWEPGYNSTAFALTGSRSARFFNGTTNSGNDYLFTECFKLDAGVAYKVEFWYRAESATFPQNIRLVASTDVTPSSVTDTLVDLQLFNNIAYQLATGIFTAPTSGVYYFGWHAYSPAANWYAYIDNINIRILAPLDAGVVSVNNINDIETGGSGKNIQITLQNFGSQTLTSVPVSFTINGGTPVTETWTGIMDADSTSSFTFATPFIVPDGNYTICAYTELPGDGNPGNDKTCVNKYGLPVFTVPYIDDFEGVSFWYTEGVTTQWQLGQPTASIINTAHSPVKVWATQLNGNYANNSSYYLYSPMFNFSQSQNMVLGFWHWIETENGVDGGKVQYTTNNGMTWTTLGVLNDPNGTNWYNASNISNAPGFSGSSGGWQYSEISLSSLNLFPIPVQFRFHFFSNASVSNNGWAIDDIVLYQPQIPNDAGVIEIIAPVGQSVTGSPNQVTVTLKNFGTQTLTSIPVSYRVMGGPPPVNAIWNGILLPDAVANFTFPTAFIGPFSNFTLCSWTNLSGDIYKFNDTTCVELTPGPANIDGSVIEILSPLGETMAGANVAVSIRVRNMGLQPLVNIPVQYFINTIPQATESIIGTLNPGEEADYTFITTFVSPLNDYQLCAKTSIAGDAIIDNDQLCQDLTTDIAVSEQNGIRLLQNMPNPSDEETLIGFSLPSGGRLVLTIRNVLGEVIYMEAGEYTAGLHHISVNTKSLAAGVYSYSITFDQQKLTRKMIVQ